MSVEIDLARCLSYCRPGAQWSLDGNTLSGLQMLDGSTIPTQEELDAALEALQAVKIWPNVQQFMAEFTMAEKAQIGLSTDMTIAALRLELTTWLSTVESNDQRVVTGLNKLVELAIIDESRKAEILTITTP